MARLQPKETFNINPVNHGAKCSVTSGLFVRCPDGLFKVSLRLLVGDGLYIPSETFETAGEALEYINEVKKAGVNIA